MIKPINNSILGKYLIDQELSYNTLYSSLSGYSFKNKAFLDFGNNAFRSGYITLEDITYKFAQNRCIVKDDISFTAVIEAEFSRKVKYRDDYDTETEYLWFCADCKMKLTDKLQNFEVGRIATWLWWKWTGIILRQLISRCRTREVARYTE